MTREKKMVILAFVICFLGAFMFVSNAVEKGEKKFYLSTNQIYPTDQKAYFQLETMNIDYVEVNVYKVDLMEFFDKHLKFDDIGLVDVGDRKPIRSWREKTRVRRNNWWSYKNVAFPIKEPAAYLIEGIHEDLKGYTLVIISDLAMVTKRSPKQMLIYVTDRKSGEPLPAYVVFSNGEEIVSEGYADEDGLIFVESRDTSRFIALAKYNENYALSNLYSYGSSDYYTVYTYTDRPIYRPNHTVHFKGIVRQYRSGKYYNYANKEVSVRIIDPDQNTIYQKERTTTSFGTYSGEVTLGDEPPLGFYRIETTVGGYTFEQSFRVDEYKKPEFEVKVTTDKSNYIQGEAITATISARYYFGEPVRGADVTYFVYRSRYYLPWWYFEDPIYSWYYGDEGYYGYGEEIVIRESATLDKDGKLVVEIPTEKLDHDMAYRIEARVVDKSRREITNSTTAKATRAAFSIIISTNKYLYKLDEEIKVKIRTVDFLRKPVSTKVTVEVSKRNWRKRGGYSDEELAKKEVITDENGIARLSFSAEVQGYVYIYAYADDEFGNLASSYDYAWVTGKGYWWGNYSFGELDIIPDKNSYSVGEIARVMISSPYQDIYGLITIEGDEIYNHQVVYLEGNSTVINIPIKEVYSPNAFISVSVIYNGQFSQQMKLLVVPPEGKFVSVKITSDQEIYKPRDTGHFEIETTNYKGEPVNAEVSLGVVDESIYAIQAEMAPDIRKFFYGKRYNIVYTYSSFYFRIYGYSQVAKSKEAEDIRASFELSDFKGEEEEYAKAEIRKEFPDTALWLAHVVTGTDGKAQVDVKYPDSLTTWRATSRAVTLDTKVGAQTQKTIVRKNLIVRLETPRFFTQKDELLISAIVHNYLSEDKKSKVILEAEGLELLDDPTRFITVAKEDEVRVDWKVRASKAGEAVITATALTDEESDAMQLTIPILPHGMKQIKSISGEVKDSEVFIVDVPPMVIKESTEFKLILSPSLASTMLDALDYLTGYPYGCVEQTMSRFLPDVMVGEVLENLDLTSKKLEEELPKMVKEGLKKLYKFQHSDGGWGWWEFDESHPFMTAYVVYGLTVAVNAGFDVDREVLERGIDSLKDQVRYAKDKGTKTYMLYALSFNRNADIPQLDAIYKDKHQLNDYSKALLAMTLDNMGDKERALAVLKELEESAQVTGNTCHWGGKSWHYGWMDDVTETTAYVFKAFARLDPANELLPKTIRWLINQRRGNRWNSTKDTAAIIYAFVDYLNVTGELYPNYTAKVYINGELVKKLEVTRDNLMDVDTEIKLTGEQVRNTNIIRIDREGEGKLYYSTMLTYFTQEDDIKARNDGIIVKREYFEMIPVQSREGDWFYGLRSLGDTIPSGKEIYVKLRITAGVDYQYVIFEDPFPSGCEVIKDDTGYIIIGERTRKKHYYRYYWDYWYSSKEFRDEKAVFFATDLPRGTYELNYILRSQIPGDCKVMPTLAYLMYAPEVRGNSNERELSITE